MRTAPLALALLLAGCGSSSAWQAGEPPAALKTAERLKREGRTGEALVVLQRNPIKAASCFPFLPGRGFDLFDHAFRMQELRWELLQGPLELAPTLIELEPEPKPNRPDGLFRGKKKILRGLGKNMRW